jgi:hypothetical protein
VQLFAPSIFLSGVRFDRRPLRRFAFGVEEAKTPKTKGFISPNEMKGFALVVVSY